MRGRHTRRTGRPRRRDPCPTRDDRWTAGGSPYSCLASEDGMIPPDRGPRSAATNWIPYATGGSYRWFTGSLAFVLHRVSGLALLVYLFFHILSITKANSVDPTHYDLMIRRFQEP